MVHEAGTMEKLEEKKRNEKSMSALTFSKIHGIGPATSRKFADEGYSLTCKQ